MRSSSTPTRRTQAERSNATREALLNATVESLIEIGYAATTTARVADRAGVSRGAHLHHFQTRQALVTAAVEHLAAQRAAELMELMGRQVPRPLPERLDLVWQGYTGPLFQAALALWSSARSDPGLHQQLVAVEQRLDQQTAQAAAVLFPEIAERTDRPGLVEMLIATVRGLALLDTLQPESHRGYGQWQLVRGHLERLFRDSST
ncbi:TetR/AcrR family transcriptional regulator [Plantactinospora sp. WMMB334]|uniref:TetR/AcrR family transcriptional regulator n=1 Tax=Plantactinospora sp. WMMB334 TaxID=3404119 RepID=UPI003B932467